MEKESVIDKALRNLEEIRREHYKSFSTVNKKVLYSLYYEFGNNNIEKNKEIQLFIQINEIFDVHNLTLEFYVEVDFINVNENLKAIFKGEVYVHDVDNNHYMIDAEGVYRVS